MKLYAMLDGWKRFDCYNKEDLINKMIDLSNKFKIYNFLFITTDRNNCPTVYTIPNEESLKQYIKQYKEESIKNMTCLELKDYITKDVKVLKK